MYQSRKKAYRLERYHERLQNIPPSGGGGCHPALLGVANVGVWAGLDDDTIFEDIREHVDDALRPVPDREIDDAIFKARKEHDDVGQPSRGPRPHPHQKPRPAVSKPQGRAILDGLIQQGAGATEEQFLSASPVPIPEAPQEQLFTLLKSLYALDEILFIGDRLSPAIPGKNLRKVGLWLSLYKFGVQPGPHIIPNPLTGRSEFTQTGEKKTRRGDRCVDKYRFTVVEFDDLSREDQLAFWAAVDLPVCALIDTGGKSIHGWVATEGITDAAMWDQVIKGELYRDVLEPLGVDSACKNPSRLSRTPGHRRDGQRDQRCLYLNPEGAKIKL